MPWGSRHGRALSERRAGACRRGAAKRLSRTIAASGRGSLRRPSASSSPSGHRAPGGLGALHDPELPGPGGRLRGHLLRPEHDARGGVRHLDAGRLQYGAHGEAPHRPERGARVLRRPAAHRQAEPGDQDHRRRCLPAVARGDGGPGGIRRARHPDRGRGGRPVGAAGVQAGTRGARPPGTRRGALRDGGQPVPCLRARGGRAGEPPR